MFQIDTTWHQGDIVNGGILIVMAAGYVLSRKTDARDREKARNLQADRHAENSLKLEHLGRFTERQDEINRQRDDQVRALTALATTAIEAQKGFNRRLELIEGEVRDNRQHDHGRD